MNNLRNLLKHIGRSWQHHPIIQLTSLIVLTGTFTVIFSMTLFFTNLERVLVSWGSSIDINIYLEEGLKDDKILSVQNELSRLNYFKAVEFMDSKTAADKFFKKMSSYVPDFSEDKDFLQAIPASFLGTLSEKSKIADLKQISKKILSIAGVEDVSYGQEWIENFSIFLKSLKNIGYAISALLTLGSFFVLSFMVYSVIVRRKEEIEIFKLFGATPKMIKAPFLFESALMTFIAASFAMIFTYMILVMQNKFFISEMSYLGLRDIFYYFNFFEILMLLAGCTLLGVFCANLCLKRMDKSLRYSEEPS